VLLRGIPALADFDVPAAADAEVAALRAKVVLREDERFTSAYPAHFGASLQLELKSGETLSHDIPDALGDPENPLPEDSLRMKAHMLLADAGYSPDAIRGAVSAAMELSANAGVERLMRSLA
jgi:2-methylcitrate dehydratase PrpD